MGESLHEYFCEVFQNVAADGTSLKLHRTWGGCVLKLCEVCNE